MGIFVAAVRVVLAALALRRVRWAYVLFIVLGLLSFPAKVGWRLRPRACWLTLDPHQAALSLAKWPHVLLLGLFFMLSSVHFSVRRWSERRALGCAAVMTLVVGALVEVAEGITGSGNCRLPDLLPVR